MGRDMEKGDPESPPNAWMKNGWEMEQEKARAKRERFFQKSGPKTRFFQKSGPRTRFFQKLRSSLLLHEIQDFLFYISYHDISHTHIV